MKRHKNYEEGFHDYLTRLFPNDDPHYMHINDNNVKNVTFQVTENCNLRCTYCYQHEKRANRMTFDVAKRFIDMLLASDERTNQYITSKDSVGVILEFIGGEPFLEIDLIDQITEYFKEQTFLMHHPWATRYRISISSNGLLYFDPKVQEYIKKNHEHLSLNISIDGNRELHDSCRIDREGNGSYDRAIAAVRHYTDVLHGSIGSKMTIAPGNVMHVYSAVVSMIENGYRTIHLNTVYEEGWTNEHAKIMYDQLKKLSDYLIDNDLVDEVYLSLLDNIYGVPQEETDIQNWCGGNGRMIGVDYKGDIYPCLRYMDNAICGKQEPYIIGNVYDGIMQTQTQCDRVHCLGCVNRRSQSTDECFNCPISLGCGWCTAYNYEVTGTPNKRVTYSCQMHKARVLAISYLWNTWYRKKGITDRYKLYIPEEWAVEIIGKNEWDYLCNLAKEDD